MRSRQDAVTRIPVLLVFMAAIVVLGAAYLVSPSGPGGTVTSRTTPPRTTIASSLSTSHSTVQSSSTVTKQSTSSVSFALHSTGYVGCSNTADAVAGYYLVPNKELFWRRYNTGGGSLEQWTSSTSQYWTLFDQQVQTYGQPTRVWVQICERAAAPLNFAMVQQVFAILKQKAPSAAYYISPLNSYSPSDICALTGPNGVADSAALANQAISNRLALAGPVIGPLTTQNTVSDMCHPNTAGESLLGSQLASFFDG